jgi:hypothetical protein
MSTNMNVLAVKKAQKAFPTGNPSFCVMQPFPAAFTAEESDPFLMCDRFGPVQSTQTVSDPDHFPVAWHPHRGMDICTYLTEGISRHADSLGNRGTYAAPGLQVPTTASFTPGCSAAAAPTPLIPPVVGLIETLLGCAVDQCRLGNRACGGWWHSRRPIHGRLPDLDQRPLRPQNGRPPLRHRRPGRPSRPHRPGRVRQPHRRQRRRRARPIPDRPRPPDAGPPPPRAP